MTNETAVSLIGISKKYQLYNSLQERVFEALHPFKKTYHREFWALRDITLDIPTGRTVGILGLNGSGKSTLLQIICSILQPTTGLVRVRGRVAALIELGAGFNPELTGRANAELNSVLMGLSSREIKDRLPKIESFADIGEFFDQPVKTYSSGMFMRVAFATAINVDPDILVIDEALAVGDAKFQEKCFRKFREFQDAGKTIIYVTHDRSSVPQLCSLGILMHKGCIVEVGEPKRIVDLYGELLAFGHISKLNAKPVPMQDIVGDNLPQGNVPLEDRTAAKLPLTQDFEAAQPFSGEQSLEDRCHLNPAYNKYEHRSGNGRAEIIDFMIRDRSTINPTSVYSGTRLDIDIKILYRSDVETPNMGLVFKNKEGIIVYGINTEMMKVGLRPIKAGEVQSYRFKVRFAICAGDWFVDFCIAESSTILCDYRCALVHLYVMEQHQYVGLTRLETEFHEIDEFGTSTVDCL